MTPREHLEGSIKHYETAGATAEEWVEMPGFIFIKDTTYSQTETIIERTARMLLLSDDELEEEWAKWQIEREET